MQRTVIPPIHLDAQSFVDYQLENKTKALWLSRSRCMSYYTAILETQMGRGYQLPHSAPLPMVKPH